MKVNASRHIQSYADCIGLGISDEGANEPENVDQDDRTKQEVLAVRADIYLAMRVEYNIAIEKWDLAADISKYLAEKYPEQPQWWVHWANALKEMQRLKEAKKVAMRGLKMHPDLTVLHFNIACYDALLGKFRSARKRLHRAIKQNPRLQDFTLNDPDLVRLQDWCRTVKV
jgi:tetratricopeptide (TPR) repeat protein